MKSLGSATSTTRSADQTLAARYWAENPPATWSRIFRTLSAQQGVSLVDNARLYAMLYMTAADALITVWNDKAHYLFWRPITAIREADTDGNPDTTADPDVAAADPDAAVHGALLRAQRSQQLVRGDAAGLLRHRPDRVDGHEQRRPDQELHADLGCDRRDRRGCVSGRGSTSGTADEQGAKIGKQVAQYRERHFFERVHGNEDGGGGIFGG